MFNNQLLLTESIQRPLNVDPMSLKISDNVLLREEDILLIPIRAQGAGGQNVNKVASAIHLRFDIAASSLPDFHKQRLLQLSDSRISDDGIVVIKAQAHRSQQKNREDAIARLIQLIQSCSRVARTRRATRPSKAARKKRMESKNKRGKLKNLRKKVTSS